MKNKKTGFIAKFLVLVGSCFLLASFSPSLDGRAVVVDEGVFPQGLFAKTVGYVPGDTICVTNVAGDKNVDILVIGALDPSEGVAIMLSPEAALVLGIEKDQNNIVKITKRTGQSDRVFGTAVITAQEDEPDVEDESEEDSEYTQEDSEAELEAEAEASEETFQENPLSQDALAKEEFLPEEDIEESEEIEEESVDLDETENEDVPVKNDQEETSEPEEENLLEEENIPEEEIEQNEAEEYLDEEVLSEETVEEDEEESVEEEIETEKLYETEPPEESDILPEEAFEEEPLEETSEEKEIESEEVEVEESFAELPEIEEETAEDTFEEKEEELGKTIFTIEGEDEEVIELGTTIFEAPINELDDDELVEEDELEESEEEYDAIVLIPTESNPPVVEESEESEEAEEAAVEPETEVKAVTEVQTFPVVEVVEVKEKSYEKYMVSDMSCLEKGKYYVQIAALGSDENIMKIINKYADHYPITIVPTGKNNVKTILIGALTMDEYKVVLERFKSYGHKDAFLRKIK